MLLLHVSDIHFRLDYGGNPFTKRLLDEQINPTRHLMRLLEGAKGLNPDGILCTGDLVHRGGTEDYLALNRLFDQFFPSVPFLCSLGNHDNKAAFFQANQLSENRFYSTMVALGNYRIVSLDSGVYLEHDGLIDEEQFSWFKQLPAAGGQTKTLLLVHHPLTWHDGPQLSMPAGYLHRTCSSQRRPSHLLRAQT